MTTRYYETPTHVFELTWVPGDEVPGVCNRELTVRLASGSPLTPEQWGRVQQAVVRELIGAGSRVYSVTPGWEECDERD